MEKTRERLAELIRDHQLYHSDFQMDNFITMKAGVTPYGQYKQALRELFKRLRGLKQLHTEREQLALRILHFEQVQKKGKQSENRMATIEVPSLKMDMQVLQKNIDDTEREFQRFYAQADALKKQIGELTPERRDELEREHWKIRLTSQACIEVICNQRVSVSTMTAIWALPQSCREYTLGVMKNDQPEEWLDLNVHELEDVKALPVPENVINELSLYSKRGSAKD